MNEPEQVQSAAVSSGQELASDRRQAQAEERQPYSAPPSPSEAKGLIGCIFCGHAKFRRSRVRLPDLGELLMFRYPLRCMRCNQRQYGWFLAAAMAHAAKPQTARVARGNETWQAWTNTDASSGSLQRPMTSVTNRATSSSASRPASRRSTASRQHEDRPIW